MTCTLHPWDTAKACEFGSRAASQIGGWGACTGFGTTVVAGKDQVSRQ